MLSYSNEQLEEILDRGECLVLQFLNKRAIEASYTTKPITLADLKRINLVKVLIKLKHLKDSPNYQCLLKALTKII